MAFGEVSFNFVVKALTRVSSFAYLKKLTLQLLPW